MASPERAQWAQLLRGRVLRSKWRLDRLIAYSEVGAVYAGTHRNGREAAIKILAPDQAQDEATRARFLREGYVANRLRHPGAVAVLDDDVAEDGTPFLVMELLAGETLHERWVKSGMRLDLGELLSITDQLLDILAAAHELGIVHRDVKPQNVMVLQNGTVKLLDFGLALLPQSERDAWALPTAAVDAVTSLVMGTPAFMPPEQALARWDLVDGRADVWAVGAIDFTLIAGRHVHMAPDVSALLFAAASQPAPSLGAVARGVPFDVMEIVDRALAFHRESRWPDARAMQRAVRGAHQLHFPAILGAVPGLGPWPPAPPPMLSPSISNEHSFSFGRLAPLLAFALIVGTVVLGLAWAMLR